MSSPQPKPSPEVFITDALRLEAVLTCVNFDDILDETASRNFPLLDTLIVVTSHGDKKTKKVCQKHGLTCVPTDLFQKNGRLFNKGAAINAGMNYYQYYGWRMHLDVDIILPPHFRRMLFNHTQLDKSCLYGADRVHVLGVNDLKEVDNYSQHARGMHITAPPGKEFGSRFIHNLEGYQPLGYFQLWHSSCQKRYPYSLGNASHDDTMFSSLWPETQRRLLPSSFVYHLITEPTFIGQNWEGRKSNRLIK